MLEWLLAQATWLAPVSVIAGAISGVLGAIYGVYRLRKVVLRVIEFFLKLLGLAESAVSESRKSKDATKGSSEALEDMKGRIDGLLGALARQESQELRLKRIERYLADHEAERRKQGASE